VFSPILLDAGNPGPMTGSGNNTYLLAGTVDAPDGGRHRHSHDRTAALVDAGVGAPEHLGALRSALAAHRARLTLVLVTHGHRDHAAGAPAIAAAHPDATFAKYPWPGEDVDDGLAWQALRDGEQVVAGGEPLTVLHTPGHSPDHLTFWHDASGSAFTGDLVVLGSSVMIHTSGGGNLAQYLATLERLIDLKPSQLLPAHGPRIDDPRAVLSGYLEHRRARERQVIAALRAGRDTVQAIAESIYDGLDPALVPAARENVLAHLEKLEAEGRAVNESGRWGV
jgi:glyoxylase-like metal-dependent hydrolase (beta-lactamase superfamily II)